MKKLFLLTIAFLLILFPLQAQKNLMQYEPSKAHPFGLPHPNAPEELTDFAPMIGICDCRSLQRNQDDTWPDTSDMVWQFKYIMNGHAIQDESWKEDHYSSSIRQFNPDSNIWVVSYHSHPKTNTTVPVWTGKKEGDQIVLYKPHTTPSGLQGQSRLTFYNIDKDGFDWKGEWIHEEKEIIYPFWYIWCKKRE